MPVVTAVAVRRGGTDDLLRRLDELAAATPAACRRARLAARRRAASCAPPSARPTASSRPPCSMPDAARHLTARLDAVLLHPVAGLVILLALLFVMFQAVFTWAQPVMDLISAGFDCARRCGARTRCPPACCRASSQNGVISGVGSVHRLPAADPDPVPVHPAAGRLRLHGARRLPDGPHHGRRRPARPRLHPAAVELRLRHSRHHGDARDRQRARPADHHPGGAADDLLGAHPGLHADHLRLHPGQARVGLRQPAGAGDVRPLRRRHRQRARRVVRSPSSSSGATTRRRPSCWNCRTTSCRGRAASLMGLLHARQDVPAARRHDDLLDDGADLVPGLVPAPAGGRDRAGDRLQPRRHASATRSSRCWRRSASTGRSTSR